MARISAYSAVTTLQDTDQFIIARSSTSENFSMTVASLRQKGFINTEAGTQAYVLGLDSAGKVIKFASSSLGNVYQNIVLTDGATVNWDVTGKTVSTALLDTNRTSVTLNISNLNEGTHHTLFVRKQNSSALVITTGGQIYKVGSTSTGNTITLNGVAYTLFKIDFNKVAGSVGTTVNVESVIDDGNKGDITVANQNTWTINNSAVTDAKILSVSWSKVTGAPLFELQSNKGVAGGYPSLDSTGKIPISQLPSFGSVSSVGLSMPSGFTVTNSPVTGSGVLTVVGAGTSSDYIDGTGAIQAFPTLLSADKMVTVGRNSTGSTLYKGTVIYLSGSTGNRPNFVKAQANAESTSAGTFGVVLADIPNNSDGQVVTIGTIDSLDTRSNATNPFTSDTLVDGDTLYLSPTTAGYVTRVKPSAPYHLVYIGKVARTSPTNGTIVYRIQNGYELDEIHDVAISGISNNDIIAYESSTNLYKNKSISTVLGYTPQAQLNGTGFVKASGTTISYESISLTSDVTGSGTNSIATTITAGAVTLAKMANLVANSIIGNNTGVSATPIALTGTQVTAMLDVFGSTTKGLVPSPAGATTTFLRADGVWATPSVSGLTGTGTSGRIPKFTSSTSIGDSNISDNGTEISTLIPLYVSGDVYNNSFRATQSGISTTKTWLGVSTLTTSAVNLNHSTSTGTITANNNYIAVAILDTTVTEAASGTHNLVASLGIKPISLANSGATASYGATLYIEDSISGTFSSGTYALWVDNGNVRLDGITLFNNDFYNNHFYSSGSQTGITVTWLGSSSTNYFSIITNNSPVGIVLPASSNFTSQSILARSLTTATSGTHNFVSSLAIKPVSVTANATTPASVTNGATLYIEDSITAVGGATITNNYSIWVDNGTVRLDGALELQTIPAKSTETNVLYYDTGTKRVAYGTVTGGGTGTVTNVSVVTANGISGTVTNSTTNAAITLTLGAITPTTVNGLTFTAAASGFNIAGGTTSKTLTVLNTLTLSGTDTSTLNIGGGGTLGSAAFTASTAYQASNNNLTSLAGLAYVSGTYFVKMTGANAFALDNSTYISSLSLTGDISGSGSASIATTIASGAVTLAKMANLAANSIIGNNTGVAATPLALTGTQVTAMLDTFSTTTTTKGLVSGSNGVGATYFLNANGTWSIPTGTATGSNTGDVTLATNSGLQFGSGQTLLAMGTPSSITTSSTNSVTTNTHTHAITPALGFIGNGSAQYQVPVTGATTFTPTWTTAINLYGASGLNALTYVSGTYFVKMTGANAFALDSATYEPSFTTLPISKGGTGSGTAPTAFGVIYASSTTAYASTSSNVTITKQFLSQTGNGTVSAVPVWGALVSGDIPNNAANTSGSAGSVSGTNVITNANLRQSAARSVIGNATNATANVADISTTTADQVLISTATTLTWGTVTTAAITNSAVTYAKIQNVAANTFLANATASAAAVQEIATTRIPLFATAITGTASSTTFLRGDGSWVTPATGTTLNGTGYVKMATTTPSYVATIPTADGGTNLTSFTANGAMYATSTSVLTTGTLPVASGGTGVTSVTTTPTASAFAGWDANANLSADNFIPAFTTVSTGTTTVLDANSSYTQYYSGTAAQIYRLPSNATVGMSFRIINASTAPATLVTIEVSAGVNLVTIASGSETIVTCLTASTTATTAWRVSPCLLYYSSTLAGSGSLYTASLTETAIVNSYTIPANTLYTNFKRIRLTAHFLYSTATSGTPPSITIRVRAAAPTAGTLLNASPAIPQTLNQSNQSLKVVFDLLMLAAGTATNCRTYMHVLVTESTASAVPTTSREYLSGNGSTAKSLTTTGAITLNITAVYSAAQASTTIQAEHVTIEYLS